MVMLRILQDINQITNKPFHLELRQHKRYDHSWFVSVPPAFESSQGQKIALAEPGAMLQDHFKVADLS